MENKTMENEEITKYTITTEIPIYIRLAMSIKPISDIRAVLDRIELEVRHISNSTMVLMVMWK